LLRQNLTTAIIGPLTVSRATLRRADGIVPRKYMSYRIVILALCLTAITVESALQAQQTENAQSATAKKDPLMLRAHDEHQDVLVAADPWTDPEQYKARFSKKGPTDAGIVAIDVYLRNDGAMPLQVNLQTIRLTIAFSGEPEQNMAPLSAQTVAQNVYTKPVKNPSKPRIPLTGSGNNNKQVAELAAQLRQYQLSTDLVPPHGTVNGFLYFDIDGHYEWIEQSRLYVPDLKVMGTNKTLFFFDVPLGVSPAP
jgi:hypothetical protein